MPDRQQPFRDVCSVLNRVMSPSEKQIVSLGSRKHIILLKYTATFAEHQFGKRLAGKRAYERNSGDHMSNWDVEINALCAIYNMLAR
jgi:hypothetical protein